MIFKTRKALNESWELFPLRDRQVF